jgi:uncharacterized protein (TIGR02266 family)
MIDIKDDFADKRAHPRAVATIEIEFKKVIDFVTSYLLNVSNGGLFVKTDDIYPLDSIVFLRFTMPGDTQPIEVEGKVVWRNMGGREYFPKGMGIKFLKLNDADNEKIKIFVTEHLALIKSHSVL